MKRALALLFLTSCSVESGKLPVVDEFVLPESATLDADGTYHVDATISFHDDDDVVKRVRVQVPALGVAKDYTSPSGKSVTKGALPLQIVGTAPKGALTLHVQVLDSEGNVSDPKSASITLK
jgi:hypothetical protein